MHLVVPFVFFFGAGLFGASAGVDPPSTVGAGLPGLMRGSSSLGDLNGDGHLDLVLTGMAPRPRVVGSAVPTAKLYLGDGQGGFTDAGAGLTGVWKSSSSLGDVDGDGNLDLVVTGEDAAEAPTTTVYLGDGRGGLTEAEAGLPGVVNGSSSLGDVDGDGSLDLLVTGRSEEGPTAKLYLGDGRGGFTETDAGLVGVLESSSSLGDVDGDGDLDAVLTGLDADERRTARVYLGDGRGGFMPSGAELPGIALGSSSLGDVNGDGSPDLILTGESPDVDGDGHWDPRSVLLLGDGRGGFTETSVELPGLYQSSSELADADGDGDLDLVLAGRDDRSDPTSVLLLGDGEGGFSRAGARLVGVAWGSLSLGDVRVDGWPDLVLTGFDGSQRATTKLYLADRRGRLTEKDARLAGVNGSSSLGDVNGDGVLDLVLTGPTARHDGVNHIATKLYLGDGGGGFAEIDVELPSVAYGSSSMADVDGDGHTDLLLTGEVPAGAALPAEMSGLYGGDGEGGFRSLRADLVGVRESATGIADVDGDGAPDLLITGRSDDGPVARLYLGDGRGSFAEAGARLTGVEHSAASVADVNGDGHADLVLAGDSTRGSRGTPTATLYLGDGRGSFDEADAGLTGVQYGSSSVGDVNEDGNPDLLLTGKSEEGRTSSLYLGDGRGGFAAVDAGLTDVWDSASEMADMNGDGHLDLIIAGTVAGTGSATKLYLGDGRGSFSAAEAGFPGVSSASISVGDANRDGNLDFVLTGLPDVFEDIGEQIVPITILYLGDGAGGFTEAATSWR